MGKEAQPRLNRHRRGNKKGVSRNAATVARTKELEAERAAAAVVELAFGSPEPQPVEEPVTEAAHPPPPKRRKGIHEKRRRHAIHELYVGQLCAV